MITITSYGGIVFEDIGWLPISPGDERDEYAVTRRETPRAGNTSLLSLGAISPRRVVIDFAYRGVADIRAAVDELLGVIDPRSDEPRLLVGTRYDATEVQRYARVEIPSGTDANGSLHVNRVVFVSEIPEWIATTPVTESISDDASPFQLAITNAGQATVHPVYQIGWTAQHSAKGTVVGQQYRRRMTLTNTQDRVLAPFPYRIDLGDTAALTTAKAQADGDDVRIIINGEDMTRKLIGFDLVQSYVWVTIPGMDAGEVLTIDVVYGNASATNPDDWSSILDLTRPVPDMKYDTGTATGAPDTSQLIDSSQTWATDEWYGGYLLMLTGTLAGQERWISGNTATTLVLESSFGATIDAGDTYLVSMSRNSRWIYATAQVEHTNLCRGRFNVNSGSYPPSAISYDAPGSWQPALVRDNRDEFGQKRYSFLTMGGSDRDPFALLDVRRQWEGNVNEVPELGTADGLSLTTPMPIEGLNWEYQISNQNGMCTVFVGVRESGAEDWAAAFTDTAVTAGSSFVTRSFSPTTLDLVTDFDPLYQIVTALLPVNDIEIPLDWKSDNGSATSGSTNYTEDLSKDWVVDQFADNGYIAMLSGPNSGRKRNVTDNTAVRLNHAAFPHANDDGDRYIVTNKPIRGLLRDHDKLYVDLDDSVLTASALGTETAVYDVSFALWVGDEGPAGDPAGQHRALIGWAGGEKRVFLTADEVIEIDSAARRVRIYNTATEEYGDELTDPAVIVQYHDGTSWRRSADWLPLGTNEQSVWIEETNIGTLDLTVTYTPAYLG
jgi:hypothetical protein